MPSRRSVLAAGLPVALAGCLSAVTGQDDTADRLSTVEDPPPWLHTDVDCFPKGSLELSARTDSVDDFTAVADYDRLSGEPQLVIRFAAQHGAAKTCVDAGATVFGRLLGELMDHGTGPYREEHGERPLSVAIGVGEGYYPVDEMTAFDQVLV